jgi:type VI secretion system protein VasG
MPDAKRLVATLAPAPRRALERAAQRALRGGHAAVEPAHLLLELCAAEDTDIAGLLGAAGQDRAALIAGLTAAVGRFAGGSPRVPALSAELLDTLCAAWVIASVDHGLVQTDAAAILDAIRQDPARLAALPALQPILAGRTLPELAGPAAARPADGVAALAAYTIDLTALAQDGALDPVTGRDAEIGQIVDVLMRRQQNNPILTGPAGVGKTAIVEGFACRVAAGGVPPRLAGLTVRSLDLGLLQAGAALRGEFEQRLRAVLDAAAASTPRTVLFIDEAHMLIGAGGAAGQGDAANLLKPALARSGLAVIAATTAAEYQRFIAKDPALARRFQTIRVAEPSEAATVDMLRSLAPKLEAHHGIRILEEALADAVRLSHRFVTGRQLPEKAIAVLDTACARVAIARAMPPAALEEAARQVAALDRELARLRREAASTDRLEALEDARGRAEEDWLRLSGRWQLEQDAVARLAALEEAGAAADAAGLRLELAEMRQDQPGSGRDVDSHAVAAVIAGWTGIPVGRMLADTVANARDLKARLAARIVGQDAALDTICRRIQTFFADLGEPGKPTGVFLLCGPSGVGKTETALGLADLLFGGPRALVTVNMSEYQEAHTVSGLRGAPPGYVGYGRGGVLTEAVRRQPYCVLLLDEIEKAHPDVAELFYQVFDRGLLEDSDGQAVDFTNTLILLTSNVGADLLSRHPDADAETLRPELLRHFPAAFLGRLVVVPYRPLTCAGIAAVTRLKLQRIQDRFAATGRGELTYHPAVVAALARRAGETDSGARMVDSILTHSVLPALSGGILDRLAEGGPIAGAHLSLDDAGGLRIEIRG